LNSFKRLILFFATIVVVAGSTILLYNSFIAQPISGNALISEAIGLSIVVTFCVFTLLFIRRTRAQMVKLYGEQAATVLQIVMGSIFSLFILFAVLSTLRVSLESLLTGAGFASITIGLIISTFVGSLLAGALVFTTHKLRVGDTVIVNNVPGTVTELTPLVTRVRTDIGQITIPNSAISSGTIVITKVQKYDGPVQSRLPYAVGDRVITSYMPGEGIVKEITALHTFVKLENGREIMLLNSSLISGAVGIAKITGSSTKQD